ncbi:hypothetical protein F5B20DRAFT_588516 [Whalleya microplaca]|nr:hypothetical protein F5B20DRAFT_588516 [Whalleya microplaca]
MGRSFRDSGNLTPVRLSNPAAEFVGNRVEINPSGKTNIPAKKASTLPTNGHGEHNEGDPRTQDGDEDIHCKQFAEVLQSFEDDLPSKYKTRFNLHGKHTWSEVIEEASIAEIKYRKKAGKESPFGKPVLDGWLDLLPSESEYGSVICGGFKIILRAAARMDEIREFVVKAMAAIPDEVEGAQLMIDYNQDLDTSRRLYKRVSSLYYTVFGILTHIITWYGQKSPTRYFKAILQQSVYEKELESRVNDFKAAVSAVKDEANLCGQHRLYNIQEDNYATRKLLESLVEQLRSNPRLHPQTGQPLQLQYTQTYAPRRKAISRQSLCESVLRYEGDTPLADLTAVMHRGSELSLKKQDQIVYVIESQALTNWLLNPKNAVLLVRGNSEDLNSGATAMSFVAAHVIQSTRKEQKSRLVCLHWFTGQHRNVRNDADANVHGVMRSLIGQLLHMYNGFDLYFIKGSTALAMRENDLGVLCNVFDELIFQLPEKTVTFCVIDWLACLEYHEKEEVQFLLNRLRAIARHASGKGSLFKLLLTHAGGTFRAAATFDGPGETLDVLEGGDGNRMGFNKLMWDAKVSSKIDHLATRSRR